MGGTENSLRHRMRNGRICVLHSGKAYDVTEFSDRHPGGKEWLVKNAGQDITQTMQNISPHKHTKTAYTILEKYRIHDSDEASKQQNGDSSSSELIHFHNTEDDDCIDWSKPIFGQVTGLKERYFEWVHQPVDQPIRLFHSDFLEFFSKCPWWLVPITWIPVTICLLLHSHATITASHSPVVWKLFGADVVVTSAFMLPLFVTGILLWTFCEYNIHRWVFHLCPPSNWTLFIYMHFLLHGQHHKSPMDRMRLVFPPLPASVIGLLIFGCYTLFSPWCVAETLFAGTLVGYMAYDLTHYYVHHGTPTSVYFSNLKRYHVKHHFEHQQLGFGISSKLWDYPFGTLIPDS